MKKTIIAGAAAVALAAPAYAELEGDLSLTYSSLFSYRGVSDIADEAARAGAGNNGVARDTFQTGLNLSWKLNDQFSIVAGGNIHTVSNSGIDHDRFYGGVRYTGECFTLEAGYQHQDLRAFSASIDSSEIYVRATRDCPLTGGTVSLFVAHDTDVLEGTYAELSLNKAWDLCEKSKVDVTAGVSYSWDYYENIFNTDSDWNHAYITVAFVYQASENLTISPYVTFSEGFGALDPGSNSGGLAALEESREIVYGIKASVEF